MTDRERVRHLLPKLVLFILCIGGLRAHADTISFDDVDASAGDVILDYLSPYHGFTFTNLSVYTSTPGFPGYNNGIVSGPNAAYTAGDALGSPVVSTITAASPFLFSGASLGSGWYDGMTVTLIGLSNGSQVYKQNVTVNTQGAQLFNFVFDEITELNIYSSVSAATTDPYGCGPSGCSQITLDDVSLTLELGMPPPPPPSPVPEPSTVILTGLGIAIALVASRRPKAQSSFLS